MKNDYSTESDRVVVWLNHKGRLWGCEVDVIDLPLIEAHPGTWFAQWDEGSQTFYARTSKGVLMHRLITNAPKSKEVDHQNHEGLDNRRLNLKVTDRIGNALNRQGANRNSATGQHGIYWHRKTSRFRAWVRINGKRKEIGGFDSVVLAQEARLAVLTEHAA